MCSLCTYSLKVTFSEQLILYLKDQWCDRVTGFCTDKVFSTLSGFKLSAGHHALFFRKNADNHIESGKIKNIYLMVSKNIE